MNKAEYVAKFEATKITDSNTVGEAKEARRKERLLRKFWENAATKYMLEVYGRNLEEEAHNWSNIKMVYNLKPTGSITVEQYSASEFHGATYTSTQLLSKVEIPKSKLLTPTSTREKVLTKQITQLKNQIENIASMMYTLQQDIYNKEVNRRRITGLRRQKVNRQNKITLLETELTTIKGKHV